MYESGINNISHTYRDVDMVSVVILRDNVTCSNYLCQFDEIIVLMQCYRSSRISRSFDKYLHFTAVDVAQYE